MALNVIAVVLFTVAAVLMRDNGAMAGTELAMVVALHAVGVGLLAVSGWLGGEIVYRRHVGIVPDDSEHARAEAARHRARTEGGLPHIAPPLTQDRETPPVG